MRCSIVAKMSRIPSRAKSKEAIDKYMKELRDFMEDRRRGNKGFDQTIKDFRVVERKNRAKLTPADFADIYLDETRYMEWVKSLQEYAEAELEHHLEMMKPSKAFLDKIEEKGRLIKEREGPTAVDTPSSERVLQKVQQLLNGYPQVRAKILGTTPESQADFDLRMRESMDAIRRYAEIEAVKDFKAQYMSEVNWQQLSDAIELQAAPQRAYDKEQDMAQVDKESARLREDIGSLQSDLQNSHEKAEELERTIQELQHQSEKEKSCREKAERELDAFKLSAGSQEAKNREDASRKAEQAARKQSELESKATRIQGDLNAARRNTESERRQYDHDLQAQKAQFTSDLEKCRQELAEAHAKLANVTEGSTQANLETARFDVPGKDAEDQQQAVAAFAKYCLGVSSAVILPSVEQMQALQSQCYESPFSEGISGLPAIVIAGGQMPAAWSYLSFVSGGVSMDSRFNQPVISPAVCSELPWIHDTLARVTKAVFNETRTADLERTLIVVLQGIAYVHLAALLWMKKSLMPEPSTLLASLAHIERGDRSVLGMIHQQVYNLVHHGTRFTSWVREGFTGELLSSTNSALPQDVALIHRDTPGTVFMAHSSVGLFIVDEQALEFDIGWMTAKLGMPPGIPDDLRQMDLAGKEHIEALKWALSISKL